MIHTHIALIYMNDAGEVSKAFLLKNSRERDERIFHGSKPSVLLEAVKNPNATSAGFEIIGDDGSTFVPPYIARVVAEFSDLSDKLGRLNHFISGWTDAEKTKRSGEFSLLTSQSQVMTQYLEILRGRISLSTGINP